MKDIYLNLEFFFHFKMKTFFGEILQTSLMMKNCVNPSQWLTYARLSIKRKQRAVEVLL